MSPGDLRYDEVRQKSIHNCFQRHEGILDQFAYWRIRSFEADIHRAGPFTAAVEGDWHVFHECWDASTSVETLGRFLSLVRAMRAAVPGHEALTLFLDLKDPLDAADAGAHSAGALDALLRERLGVALYTPSELLGGARTLQEAISGGWPRLAELRGRVLVVLTGKTAYMDRYAANDRAAAARVAFVSRRVERATQVPGPSHVLFYNMCADDVAVAAEVRRHRLISRAYYVDSAAAWRAARAAKCHHVATDKVNSAEDPWARTSGEGGWPFEALDGETPAYQEPVETCGVWARTGDIWVDRDSLYFHYRECEPEASDHSYELLVASPNSEVEDWAKAGILARASLRQDAAYFGVFRLGEKSGLRVQLRDRAGAPTVKRELRTPRGFEPDTLAMVRLELSKTGRQADGWGSIDGETWIHIARWSFEEPLLFQGLGVSGHGSREGAKFLFLVPGGAARPRFDRGRIVGPTSGRRGWSDWEGARRWKATDWAE